MKLKSTIIPFLNTPNVMHSFINPTPTVHNSTHYNVNTSTSFPAPIITILFSSFKHIFN